MARRRESAGIKDLFAPLDDAESTFKHPRDPAEIRIYLKQLKRAMKFLPLGSRAYYYVSGEILRANRELERIAPTTAVVKGPR